MEVIHGLDDSFAHSPNANGEWQGLKDHLHNVAETSAASAAKFGAEDAGRVLGWLHDFGKLKPDFQNYLNQCHASKIAGRSAPQKGVDHKTAGAVLLAETNPLLALASYGHHGGIPDLAALKATLNEHCNSQELLEALQRLQTTGEMACSPGDAALPAFAQNSRLDCEMLTRMLFSALVDADFLDTEQHFNSDQSQLRNTALDIQHLWDLFERSQSAKLANADDSPLNRARGDIYQHCLQAAECPQGLFRLTVPTGGGKTLSGMGFALRHAINHNLDRIIVAIPYTSIIDQTAQVYRDIFGAESVIEHHSTVQEPDEGDFYSEQAVRQRLAAENWDAPIIVTTTVQLFESIFGNKPSRCRKLHNIAHSVIVIDEAQTLPTELLEPILDAIGGLAANYGTTIVLCTATQPDYSALKNKVTDHCHRLLSNAHEIVPEPHAYFEKLKRVEFVRSDPYIITSAALAARIDASQQILCVLNTRKDALNVLAACDSSDGLFHLSTLMCPHHRRHVLALVRERLNVGNAVRLIATQVVEAGVDLDFPVVMRDLGPLDRIIQVAGRCNREGRQRDKGTCVVFNLEDGATPRGTYKTGIDLTPAIIEEYAPDLDSPAAVSRYFSDLYRYCTTDVAKVDHRNVKIQTLREGFSFQSVASAFRMISENTTPVIPMTYRPMDDLDLVDNLLRSYSAMSPRRWFRRIAEVTVSVYRWELNKMVAAGSAHPHPSGVHLYSGLYSDLFGLGSDSMPDPADLIA